MERGNKKDERFILLRWSSRALHVRLLSQQGIILMIKNQRLYTQWDDASIHERGANVDVIAFG
jgi:hypothetical protein